MARGKREGVTDMRLKRGIQILRQRDGMSLVESIVAFAIIAIAAVTLVVGFTTISSTMMRGSQLDAADEALEEFIAKGEENPATLKTEEGALSFDGYSIAGEVYIYTAEDGTSFRLFRATGTE